MILGLFAFVATAALGCFDCDFGAFSAVAARLLFGRLLLAVRGLFAHQSTLWLRAVGRAVALPVADRLFADRLARRLRVGALGVAQWVLADSVALRALADFAMLDRAADFALRLVALNFAFRASEFLAAGGALWRLADRFANLVADRLVTLPLALRVAVIAVAAAVTIRVRASLSSDAGANCKTHEGQKNESSHVWD